MIRSVVDKFLAELQSQLGEKKVKVTIDDSVRAWLAHNGYDAKMGARPMARLIQEKIKKPLADSILFGALSGGGHVCVQIDELLDKPKFVYEPAHEVAHEVQES